MSYKVKYILIICILNIYSAYLTAQQLYFHKLTVENGLPHNTVKDLLQDKYGFIWIATGEGLCRYDGQNVLTYNAADNERMPINNRPIKLLLDASGNVWIAFSSTKNVCRYNYETNDFDLITQRDIPALLQQQFLTDKTSIAHLLTFGNDTWYIKNYRIYRRNEAVPEPFEYNNFDNEKVRASFLYADNQNVLWVGTENGGVYFVDPEPKYFKYDRTPIVGGRNIRAILTDKAGSLWIGTQSNGLFVKEKGKDVFKSFDRINFFERKHREGFQIRSLLEDEQGNIWIGSRDGLYRYSRKTGKVEVFRTTSSKKIPHNWVYALHQDKNGVIWIGTWKGLAAYNESDDSFIMYNVKETLPHRAVRDIIDDGNNGLWVATEGGLAQISYNLKNGKPEQLKSQQLTRQVNSKNTLNDNFVYAIDMDVNGKLWVATRKGIVYYDTQKRVFTNLGSESRLSTGIIRGVVATKEDIWVSHQSGLAQIKDYGKTIRYFDLSDGLPFNEFGENAYYFETVNNNIFWGGNQGVVSFDPQKIAFNAQRPRLLFTSLKVNNININAGDIVNGKLLLNRPFYLTDNIVLSYDVKTFEIGFTALHFANPDKNRYAYRLLGADTTWRYTDAKNAKLSYSGLRAGSYILELKAANSHGVWTASPKALTIKVLPPWWKSVWAYWMYAITILATLLIVFKAIMKRKQLAYHLQLKHLEAEQKEALAQMRTSFFTGISHELRTPVTLIADPLRRLVEDDIAEPEKKKTYALMQRNASRLLTLINQLLDFRKVEAGKQKIAINQQDIIGFVKARMGMFEWQAQQKNIDLNFSSTQSQLVWGIDAGVLDKIFVNLLSNALKYSESGTVIEVTCDTFTNAFINKDEIVVGDPNNIDWKNNNWLFIQIKDEGIGIDPAGLHQIFDIFERQNEVQHKEPGSGIGLALTRELILLHGGLLTLKTDIGKGSVFTILLPYNATGELQEGENAFFSEPHVFESDIVSNGFEYSPLSVEELDLPLLLIVEDNNDIRHYLSDALSTSYKIIVAVDGNDGWVKALEFVPDIIMSDVMMPEVSGMELCRRLKEDQRTSHIPVILLTARQAEEAVINGYENGADDYIVKPFNLNLLKSRLTNLIRSRQKLRDVFSNATDIEIEKIAINQADKTFINDAITVVQAHLADLDFTPDVFAKKMAVSRAQLFRKIKAMTGQTVVEFVTILRLKKAADLLNETSYSVKEIALMTGFSEASNFSRSFSKKYGIPPSAFGKK